LAFFTNGKSHGGFRSVPNSVTLSDFEWFSGCHFTLFHFHSNPETTVFGINRIKFTEAKTILSATKM